MAGKSSKFISCICNPRYLITFGLPLFAPAVILVAIGFTAYSDFGLIHIGGIILLLLSITCIVFGLLVIVCSRRTNMTTLKEKQVALNSNLTSSTVSENPNNQLPITPRKNDKLRFTPKNKMNTQLKEISIHKSSSTTRKTKRKRRRRSTSFKADGLMKNTKLPTVTEDREGERLRILSAIGVSCRSLQDISNEQCNIEQAIKVLDPKQEVMLNVWCDNMGSESDISAISQSGVRISSKRKNSEITPVEIVSIDECLLRSPDELQNRRSLSLTNMLEASPELYRNKRLDSSENVMMDLNSDNSSSIFTVTSSDLSNISIPEM